MARVYNFGAGPCTLPTEVLEEARRELVDYHGTGMSIMECSHRGKAYRKVHEEALDNLRLLLQVPDAYEILLLPGGATLQFSMVAMNLLPAAAVADYILTGAWAVKAAEQAAKIGRVHKAANTAGAKPARIPAFEEIRLSVQPAYLHLTSNETIEGIQWKKFPETNIPLVADMSSDILSRPIDVKRFALLYAGAQKNLGPAGVTLVIMRRELADTAPVKLPSMLRYRDHIENRSMLNTPPCFAIYMLSLVTRWIMKTGLDEIVQRNRNKAARLYREIDRGDFYRGTAAPGDRSDMNVTFRLPNENLETKFIEKAEGQGLCALKGHRSVGGIRASIYNAFPEEGVAELCEFMRDFESRNG